MDGRCGQRRLGLCQLLTCDDMSIYLHDASITDDPRPLLTKKRLHKDGFLHFQHTAFYFHGGLFRNNGITPFLFLSLSLRSIYEDGW